MSTSSAITLDAKLKKVDSAGTITVLKTFTQKSIPGSGSDAGKTEDIFIESSSAIATLNENDIFYIETELTYTLVVGSGASRMGFYQNGKVQSYLSIDN